MDEFAYDKELLSISNNHPGVLTFIPTISRPNEIRNEGWQGEVGRVNTIIEKYLNSQRVYLISSSRDLHHIAATEKNVAKKVIDPE